MTALIQLLNRRVGGFVHQSNSGGKEQDDNQPSKPEELFISNRLLGVDYRESEQQILRFREKPADF